MMKKVIIYNRGVHQIPATFPFYIILNTSKAISKLVIQITKKAIVMLSLSIFILPFSMR